MALDPGTRLGPYEIVGPLGAGGMGEVYRARDTRLDRLVAVKVLPVDTTSPRSFERFEREAKSIAALNHPGICAVYDVGTSPVPFLVMELLAGDTLHQRLARGPMDVATLVDTGLALADALAAAHGKGIVHRDLKPANIVLTPRGPKILDFGLARIADDAPQEVATTVDPTLAVQGPITDAGVVVGTVAYMSPEQLRRETLDSRTDLFSLGLVLYEMATGRRAFAGASSAVTSAAILLEQPAPPRQHRPDLPPRLEQAILTLLEKDREVRTQTASELRAEMTRIRREMSAARASDTAMPSSASAAPAVSPTATASTVIAPPSSSDAQLVAGVMRRHSRVVAGAAAALLLVLGAAYFLGRTSPAPAGSSSDGRISIADLQVDQLTTSNTASSPAISPDGKYVAYVQQGDNADSLRVRQIATGSNVEIVAAQPGVRLVGTQVTPDGSFVTYLRGGGPQRAELWQIPFLGGAPQRLLQGAVGRLAYSPDGKLMAYVRTADRGRTEVVISAADGNGARVVATRQSPEAFLTTGLTPGLFAGFALSWSPDGRTLAAMGARAGAASGGRDTGQVVFIDIATGATRVFDAGPPLLGFGLAWLDDRWLVLSMLDRASAPLQLWLLSYPDGGFHRLSNDLSQYLGVSVTADRTALVTARNEFSLGVWTSDASAARWTQVVPDTPGKSLLGFAVAWLGDDLLYVSSTNTGFGITRWRASTRTAEMIVKSAGDPDVSRDGSTIVFFDYDTSELFKMDASGQNRVRLRRGLGGRSRFTPDGRYLVSTDPLSGSGPTVRLDPVDGGSGGREISGAAGLSAAEVSPDGRWLAYGTRNERRQPAIAVCDLETCSSKRMLPLLPRWHWTPDSQGLAYPDPRTFSDLWIQPLDGGAPRQLTRFPNDGRDIADFAWSADGQRLAVARAKSSSNIVLFRGLGRSESR